VTVDNKTVAEIGKGMVILLGVKNGDTEKDMQWLVDKCLNLRIFDNEEGKFDKSMLDIQGEIIVVSQFTLYGDCSRGRRPGFIDAARPEVADELYQKFVKKMKQSGLKVETGIFAAKMQVGIVNEGPVTIIIDSKES
jgi:D-tyrosyl-tRNA(Tyr) deacylase